ncbi:MAG: hypothetical protein OQK00_06540 [Rhodobacteraceae bacterium]|nr:hypothetical protein [Paracoccaceae bacterium]MCW9043273.1 hypothetical protein [Pseudopelagicola sp.]
MATHILWQADVADFDAWLDVFKSDARSRKSVGIVDLNVWRDPAEPNHAIALFAVTDLEKARAFFDSEELAMHLERDGVTHISLKMLTPA